MVKMDENKKLANKISWSHPEILSARMFIVYYLVEEKLMKGSFKCERCDFTSRSIEEMESHKQLDATNVII